MPIHRDDRDRYPGNWREIRARILERARVFAWGGPTPRCECVGECGRGTHEGRCPNLNGHKAYGTGSKVVLTVAHLDHTPENCELGNLRAMCQGCHLHYDREHHRESRVRRQREALEAAGQLSL